MSNIKTILSNIHTWVLVAMFASGGMSVMLQSVPAGSITAAALSGVLGVLAIFINQNQVAAAALK